jgi:hypothetical protein
MTAILQLPFSTAPTKSSPHTLPYIPLLYIHYICIIGIQKKPTQGSLWAKEQRLLKIVTMGAETGISLIRQLILYIPSTNNSLSVTGNTAPAQPSPLHPTQIYNL